MLAMPSSTTQHRVKRSSPSFSASKTEWETIVKTSFLQSSKNWKIRETEKTIHFFPFLIFYYFCSLGINCQNISFSRVFERAMCHFDLNFDIGKSSLVGWEYLAKNSGKASGLCWILQNSMIPSFQLNCWGFFIEGNMLTYCQDSPTAM